MSALTHDHAIRLTVFPNFAAQTKRNEELSLAQLTDCIARANASRKDALPWLKLATFGDLRTDKNSLRHDRNVLAITGVEGDYDAESVTFDKAVQILQRAGVLAIIYTSPRHCEDAPRWRVLCPLSREYPPDRRDAFLARLNGVLGGIFSPESWTLSQSYYYGSVARNPSHRVQLIEGAPIDLRDDLDAGAIGNPRAKPTTASARPTSNGAAHGPISERRLEAYRITLLDRLRREAAVDGAKHHALLRYATALGGIQAAAGFDDQTAVQWLLDALPDTVQDWKLAERTARDGLNYGRAKPIELEDRLQANGHDTRRPFDGGAPVDDIPLDWQDPPPEIDDPAYHEAVDADATSSLNPVAALVREFNDRYWVINEAGKAVIYEPAHDPILNRRYHNKLSFADFEKLHLNRMVKVGDKFLPAATVWLRHRDRRQYIRGVTFDPSGSHRDPEVLNLWQGFAPEPKAGDWNLMKNHIFEVICASSQEHYDYLMDWMARLIQFPAQQGEVAVVLKGIEGTGKGILARALLYILGQHGLAINHAKHLTGNFNAHLRDCVFLFADEAFYAGDRAHVGVLKALITEPTLTIEGKYANAVQTPNFIHLMMASNEDWVVPASIAARRFLVLLTAATKVGNRAYFTAIQNQMEAGGYQAMLAELQHRDLTNFNVRDVPDTEGLQEQKKLSLGTSEAWWMDVLHRGYVYKSKFGLDDHFGQWHDIVSTEVLFSSYTEYAKAKNERHPMAREAFGAFMGRMGATPAKHRNGIVGEHLTDVTINKYGDTKRLAALIKRPFATGYRIGSLEQAQNGFRNATKLPVEWQPEGKVEEVD